MIEIGDLVRIKNKHLRPGVVAMNRRGKHFKRMRGRQFIARVTEIVHPEHYDSYGRRTGSIVQLDVPDPIFRNRPMMVNEHWLQVHRKNRRRERASSDAAGR